MNIVAAAKVLTDLVQTAKTWAKDIDDVYKGLVKDIEKVDKLNGERQKAIDSKEGQKLSKTKEGLERADERFIADHQEHDEMHERN